MPLPPPPASSAVGYAVSVRKVPPLALVPRGHVHHATRAAPASNQKRRHGVKPLVPQGELERQQEESDYHHPPLSRHQAADRSEAKQSAPAPLAVRPQPLGDELSSASVAEIVEAKRRHSRSPEHRHQSSTQLPWQHPNEDEDEELQTELRLGERFLRMMALMAQLARQPLDEQVSVAPPGSSVLGTSPGRRSSVTFSLPAPQEEPEERRPPPQSPARSPMHTLRNVGDRVVPALREQLTFDICMLLPPPLDARQRPLRSPIRRKRLRRRTRRRLRRRARRTWQTSHASWAPHHSAEYIVDHARQDLAAIDASRLVQQLRERETSHAQLATRKIITLTLPALGHGARVDEKTKAASGTLSADSAGEEDVRGQEEDPEEGHDEEDELEDEDEDDEDGQTPDSQSVVDEASTRVGGSPDTRRKLPLAADDRVAATEPVRKRPLYHQPAWISPELRAWLLATGLFASKPRRDLLPAGV